MGWMDIRQGGNYSYISFTVQYGGDLPGSYPIFMFEY